MISVEATRHIAATPDRIYEFISDLPRMGEWSPENTGGRWVTSDGPIVGAAFKGTNRHKWIRWTTDVKITAADPGKHLEFVVSFGPLKNLVTWGYRLEADDAGTQVNEYRHDHRHNALRTIVGLTSGTRHPEDHYKTGMDHTLQQLAQAVEIS